MGTPEPSRGGNRRGKRSQRCEIAEQRLRDEELDVLRTAALATSLRDRSAVQAIADEFQVDVTTVYNWLEGRTKLNPLRQFVRLLDALLEGKGDGNPKALEPAWLIYRRYLRPEPAADPAAHVDGGSRLLKESGEAVAAYARSLQEEPNPAALAAGLKELDDLDRELQRARRTLEARLLAAAGEARR